jgi:transposase
MLEDSKYPDIKFDTTEERSFEPIFHSVAGLDVHKSIIMACVLKTEEEGTHHEIRQFGTMKKDSEELAAWLIGHEVEAVSMESTGIYGRELFNILQESGLYVIMTNARHTKHVPGHKTDIEDSRWLAMLTRAGLLKKSRILDKHTEDLRDLSRLRVKTVQEKTASKNRLYKLLIKSGFCVSQVVTDLFGKSGMIILNGLLDGVSPETILERIEETIGYKLKTPKDVLIDALQGKVSFVLRAEIKMLLRKIDNLKIDIEELEILMESLLIDKGQEQNLELLQTIPGVSKTTAMTLLLELGCDLGDFRSAKALASWAGMCPGNNESAGKKKNSRITQGNKHIKRVLCEASTAAVKTDCYFREKFKTLIVRRGYKRSIVAIGCNILKVVYHMLTEKKPYFDKSADFDEMMTRRNAPRWLRKLREYNYVR